MGKHKISRRSFLGQAGCAAMGSTTLFNSAIQLGMINTAAARPHIIGAPGDYKAIICILLAGGADSHNMLIPYDQDQYDLYNDFRSDLALDRSSLTDSSITDSVTGRQFALHPGMTACKSLFDSGDLSLISNIGTLVHPIPNVQQLYNSATQRPLGLYSHSDQIMQWQTSVPQDRSAVGVAGRMADMLRDMNTIDEISMNISLDGRNRFQAGNQVVEYAVGNSIEELGIRSMPGGWSNSGAMTEVTQGALNSILEETYANIFQNTYGDLNNQTIESLEVFQSALAKRPGFTHSFDDYFLSQDMRMIADIISVQDQLGANRQIFFTTFGGWDHHDEVINAQAQKLPQLDTAINDLYTALGERPECGLQDKVTILTISDFGRTLTSNTGGSDHAWGGNMLMVGGAVNGGRVFGDYPELRADNPLNIDERGRFIPQIASDQMYAELALWFGVSPNDLEYVLPNIGNFNDPGSLGLFS